HLLTLGQVLTITLSDVLELHVRNFWLDRFGWLERAVSARFRRDQSKIACAGGEALPQPGDAGPPARRPGRVPACHAAGDRLGRELASRYPKTTEAAEAKKLLGLR